jgi:hypothetical protein
MSSIDKAIEIINLLNTATPGIANLIILIKNNDGSISVPVLLDQADQKFSDNIKQATDWLKEHQK